MELPMVEFTDFVPVTYNESIGRKLINIRGCNGAGKSTVPISMLESDPDSFELGWRVDGRLKTLATVFPAFNTLALGHYHSKCGGMDSIKDTDTIKSSLAAVWNLPYNIIMEGIMASTVRQTYIDLFKSMNANNEPREIIIYNILPPLQTCLDRIQERNGGKPIKEEQVASKWRTVDKNADAFAAEGFTSIKVSNAEISREDTLEWYYNNIGEQMPIIEVKSKQTEKISRTPIKLQDAQNTQSEDGDKHLSKAQRMKMLPKYSGEPQELYLPTKEDIDGYPWAQYYKEPDENVVINWDNMKLYWYWIGERMNIWYKRTILREPQPWTEDVILQENKFTNCFRDLDRGTIVYIKEILSKMDEPNIDLVKRTKEVMLNTMIYRLFLKYDTWKRIGFLYIDTWDEQWAHAKENLREMKRNGETVWHAAYYVNDLKCANPDPKTNGDKVENAICMVNNFYNDIDDTYEYVTTHGMKDCLEYFTHFPGVATFTCYEYLCDWGMSYKHVKHPVVDWTDDDYVNIGPGNKMGLDFIFEKKGNLDYFEMNFYLRASWKAYMKRFGYYDRFIEQMPEWCHGDINMRLIEHDLCEVQKYLNVYYGTGKCRGKFKNESKNNLDSLIL